MNRRAHFMNRSFLGSNAAFTLVELLVVIAIIGVLAAMVTGLSGLASRKMKESRVQTMLNQLVHAIETYKMEVGFYPPDNGKRPFQPRLPPLYYELSGAVFTNNQFMTLNQEETIAPTSLSNYFGVAGIVNSSRDKREIKYSIDFKPSQYAELGSVDGATLAPTLDVEILIVPAKGPDAGLRAKPEKGGGLLNPWRYDASTTNRHNRNSFDLWAEIDLGKGKRVIGNWKE